MINYDSQMLNTYPSPEEELYAAVEFNNVERLLKVLHSNPQLDINHKESTGNTALIQATKNKHTGIVTELLQVPDCDINAVNNRRKSCLMYAVEKG